MSTVKSLSLQTYMVVGVAVLLAVLVIYFPSLAVVLSLLGPCIIFLIRAIDPDAFEDKAADFGVTTLVFVAFCSLVIWSKHSIIKCDICHEIVKGRVVSKTVTVTPDEGIDYQESKQSFLADTKEGDALVSIVGVIMTIVAIGSPIFVFKGLKSAIDS